MRGPPWTTPIDLHGQRNQHRINIPLGLARAMGWTGGTRLLLTPDGAGGVYMRAITPEEHSACRSKRYASTKLPSPRSSTE